MQLREMSADEKAKAAQTKSGKCSVAQESTLAGRQMKNLVTNGSFVVEGSATECKQSDLESIYSACVVAT